ncbi:hypothetical protein ACWDTI_06165 [Gordonia sp. NPDC003424]
MMQTLFDAPNCENPGVEGAGEPTFGGPDPDAEIDLAIEVFASAAMVSNSAALSARNGKTTRQKDERGVSLRILRAG